MTTFSFATIRLEKEWLMAAKLPSLRTGPGPPMAGLSRHRLPWWLRRSSLVVASRRLGRKEPLGPLPDPLLGPFILFQVRRPAIRGRLRGRRDSLALRNLE